MAERLGYPVAVKVAELKEEQQTAKVNGRQGGRGADGHCQTDEAQAHAGD